MSRITFKSLACVLSLALTTVAAPLRAEVSAETAEGINVLILGVIEGPDPISEALWQPVREHVNPALFLNPEGAERHDGRPSVAFDGVSGWPHVTWAYDSAGEFRIAYSRWIGGSWSPTELLTTGPSSHLDPRVHAAPDGTVLLAWWQEGAERVWLVHKSTAFGQWSIAEQVTSLAEAGRRPSTVQWQGQALVAYERNAVLGGQEIVVATRVAPGAYDANVVATTPSSEALDVMLHVQDDRLWLDWRNASNSFAWTAWDAGGWGPVHTLPWTDDSWAGQEAARRQIAELALENR